MYKPSETKVSIPVEDPEACLYENVNEWLDRNRQYLSKPPAEHYVMTELYDRHLRTQHYYYRSQPAPVYLPQNPVKTPCIRVSPMVPVYEKPLRKNYAEKATEKKSAGTLKSHQTYVQMEAHGSHVCYHDHNERPAHTRRYMSAQRTQTTQAVTEATARLQNDTSFVNFF